MADYTSQQLFSIDQQEIDRIQLAGLRKRFAELSAKLPALKKLVEQNRISAINNIHDVVPLLFPHTIYKSYPLALIDSCMFGPLNDWLSEFTTFDISGLDVSACKSLDEWLGVIEANTPVRVLTSSGTSGKITLMPRSTIEDKYILTSLSLAFGTYPGEKDGIEDIYAPDMHFLFPFSPHGRHSTALIRRAVIEHGLHGDESRYISLQGEMSTDVLWMSGRIKKAQADGTLEQLKKTKAWQRLSSKLAALEVTKTSSLEDYYKDILVRFKDKKVLLLQGIAYFLTMVEVAEKYGLDIRFSPDSYLNMAGGLKGATMTDAQVEKIRKAIPHALNETYGCSEMLTGLARKCGHGNYHMPPGLVTFILDPDTGVPYPRKGVQTGRFAGFDLWATTYWGGLITGDEFTVNWEGGCACGRKGYYIDSKIQRYTDKNGGDDKITCQRAASTVDEMMEHMRSATG